MQVLERDLRPRGMTVSTTLESIQGSADATVLSSESMATSEFSLLSSEEISCTDPQDVHAIMDRSQEGRSSLVGSYRIW
jgi:hypothetical protein